MPAFLFAFLQDEDKFSFESGSVTGHDLSRADEAAREGGALAPEGCFRSAERLFAACLARRSDAICFLVVIAAS
jgi:hypothetical protein